MPNQLQDLRITAVDFVDRGANPGAHITLMKRDDRMSETKELPAELAERLDKIEAGQVSDEDRGVIAKIRALFATPKETAPAEDVQKRIDEAVAAEREKREALEKRLADKEAADLERETVAKAMTLPVFGEFGPILHAIRKGVDAETYGTLVATLDRVQAVVNKSALFGPLGSDGEDTEATDKIEQLVNERVAKGESRYQARLAVMQSEDGQKAYAEARDAAIKGGSH